MWNSKKNKVKPIIITAPGTTKQDRMSHVIQNIDMPDNSSKSQTLINKVYEWASRNASGLDYNLILSLTGLNCIAIAIMLYKHFYSGFLIIIPIITGIIGITILAYLFISWLIYLLLTFIQIVYRKIRR